MKYLILCFLILSTLSPNVSKEKKLLGSWTFVKTFLREQVGENLYRERSSGLVNGEIVIEFKADHTATVIGKDGSDNHTLTWKLEDHYLELGGTGNYPFLREFEGKNEIVSLTKHELEVVHAGTGRHIFFQR